MICQLLFADYGKLVCSGALKRQPRNVLPLTGVALTGVLTSEPYVAVPALFALIASWVVPFQLIVMVLASHIAGDGETLPNIAARNARVSERVLRMRSVQISAHPFAQPDPSPYALANNQGEDELCKVPPDGV